MWPKWSAETTAKALENNIFIAPNADIDDSSVVAVGGSVWYGASVRGRLLLHDDGHC